MLRNIRLVSMLTVLAQLAAFFRTAIMANLFGASSIVDAYNLALVAPVMLAGVVGGWLQAGFVGQYMKKNAKSVESAQVFHSSMLNMILVIAICFSCLIVFGRELLAEFLVPSASETTRVFTQNALVIAGWSLIPIIVSDFLGLVLNCNGRFVAAAASPALNAVVSAVGLWLWPIHDMNALLGTLMLGWCVQFLALLMAFKYAKLRLSWPKPILSEDVAHTLKLALPVLPAVFFSNSTSVILQVTFARFGDGAVSILGYASRLHGALTQLLIIGVSTVLLPKLAGLLAEKKDNEIVFLFWEIGRITLLVYLFVLAGVFLIGDVTVVTMLGRGKFDLALSAAVWKVWIVLTISLLPFALSTFFAKLFQAKQQPVLLSASSLIALLVTAVVCGISYRMLNFWIALVAPLAAQFFVLIFFLRCFKNVFSQSGVFPNWITTLRDSALIVFPSIVIDIFLAHFFFKTPSIPSFAIRTLIFSGIFFLMFLLRRSTSSINQSELL